MRGTTWRAALIGALLACGMVLVAGSPAQAHNYLVSSTPAAGETLTVMPAEFVVTTNEPLLQLGDGTGGFALEVQDGAGLFYGGGCVSVDGSSISVPAALGDPGEYSVTWQVVSADGHTVSDRFAFTWAPEGEQPMGAGTSSVPACGAETAQPRAQQPPADLATVLWIGGALVAAGAAVGITLLLMGRRNRAAR